MASYEYPTMLSEISEKILEVQDLQHSLIMKILDDHNGGEGGLFGTVRGENGTFDVESIYSQYDDNGNKIPMIHADFPAFECDIEFDELTVSEKYQILHDVIVELRKVES